MKNLRYGSRGPDVRTLELFLKGKGYHVIVDRPGQEHYGPNLRAAVYWYQKNEGLYADKKFGPSCRASMDDAGYCKYQEIQLDRQTTVIRMDKAVTTAKVLNPKRMTIKQMFINLTGRKAKLVINGTLFNTGGMEDLAPLRVKGVDVGGGYYGDKGLKIDRSGKVSIGTLNQGEYEHMGFSPAIILNGSVNGNYSDLSDSFVNSKHPRTMVQVTNKYINVFIVRGRSFWRGWFGAAVSDLRRYAEIFSKYDNDIMSSSGNFDGGGSTGAYTQRGFVFGWMTRAIANGCAFFVEGM